MAGCLWSHPVSLANDQKAINSAQTAIARDENALAVTNISTPSEAIACATGEATQTSCFPNQSKLEARLKAARFKLQVAKDQLKKDESG